jgi:hypothetical protein
MLVFPFSGWYHLATIAIVVNQDITYILKVIFLRFPGM